MSSFVQVDTRLLVGALDLSCFANQAELDLTAEAKDATTFCSSRAKENRQGLKSWSMMANGFGDFAAAGDGSAKLVPGEEIVPDTLGESANVSVVPLGATEGNVAYLAGGVYSTIRPLGGAVGEMGAMSALLIPADQSAGHKILRGILDVHRSVTVAGNTVGANTLGAVTEGRRLGASLHVFTLAGTTPAITVRVQSDDNAGFTTPTDRIVFAAASTRQGQFGWVPGLITDTYWRTAWTVSGTTPSILFAVTIGIA